MTRMWNELEGKKTYLCKNFVENINCFRAHRNDLENIIPFFVITFFYIGLNPSAYIAINLIRTFAISRIVHTFVYAVVVIPQPARALSWFVSYLITGYMAVQVLLAAL